MSKRMTEDGEIVDVVTHEVIARPPPFFKTPFNHDTDHEALSTALACKDPSRTQQQFAKDADINNILAQFLKTGDPNLLGIGQPIYRDIMEEFDLQSVMVTGWEVEQAWKALSPEVRNVLKDPVTFSDYVGHCLERGDLQPLRDLGLAPKLDLPAKAQEPLTPPGGAAPPPPADRAAQPPSKAP